MDKGDYAGTFKIGILGGIGPEASAEFYYRLIRELQATGLIEKNTDFPHIIINSIPAPELIDQINPEQLFIYKVGLRQLDSFGLDVIVMVCNTIHLYTAELQEGISAPIIDLRAKVKQKLDSAKVRKMAVIGTPTTIKKELYKFDGIEYIELSEDEINGLSKAIFKYNIGEDQAIQCQFVEDISRRCLDKGAESVLLACTEISAMLKDADIPKIDTFEVLLGNVIEFYQMVRLPLTAEHKFGGA